MELDDYVKHNPFFMFIVGTPEAPKCKFTRKLVSTLAEFGYKYKHFDIMSDERITQWLKFYSNWPTFPQIFIDGKFVGGCDIVCEMIENKEFDDIVPKSCKKLPPQEELQWLLS
jgi:monothiol glutaredoxin